MTLTLKNGHIGISVTDVEATIEWYTEKLDFVAEQRFSVNNLSFAFLTHEDVKLEILGGATTNETPAITDIVASLNPARLHHLCIAVADLQATLEELRSRDVNVIGEPFDVAAIGQRVAFITDNSGNVIEIAEPTFRPLQA
jgi:catechol 2,3-dioxygenase-like lactoylglutathione lyase family enzyme